MKKEYIQLGIDNGFAVKTKSGLDVDSCQCLWHYDGNICIEYKRNGKKGHIQFNLIELITSKTFIKSIEKGTNIKYDIILVEQARAIANNEIDKYITYIFNNKK